MVRLLCVTGVGCDVVVMYAGHGVDVVGGVVVYVRVATVVVYDGVLAGFVVIVDVGIAVVIVVAAVVGICVVTDAVCCWGCECCCCLHFRCCDCYCHCRYRWCRWCVCWYTTA